MSLTASLPTLAQTASTAALTSTEVPVADVVPILPYGNLQNAAPEDVARSIALGKTLAHDMLESYNNRKTPEMVDMAKQARRKADDIADATLSAERNKMLNFLGIDPEADSALYYFVSWSMPLDMLRSYAIEAMWAGGSLVFKGVPPNKDLGKFIMDDLHGLVYGKGAAANISIDPRQFEAYEVTVVPTIVFTTVRANMQCQGVNPVSFKAEGQDLSYDTCPALDPATYSKISGAVTSSYALQSFIDDGFVQATPYAKSLAKGYVTGAAPVKEQQPFKGTWSDALAPSEAAAVQGVSQAIQQPPPAKGTH
ncbi:MAG: TrbC family F-type conjugative pilus assembly protein [Agitococcus sp.]|nr:TrbC family F-type conjugative pilus assembly protein [Agitococcus sp.]MDO9176959.1 TrbC family F-type conjugative pilus assembly protein [Agitococcus sp.]